MNRTGRTLTAVVMTGAAGSAWGQLGQQKVPSFKPAVDYYLATAYAYGIDSADILDANGDPGQDGFPELVVASAGTDLFVSCASPWFDLGPAGVRVFHNLGVWETNPQNSLQALSGNHDLAEGKVATEVAFADITGLNGPDIVVSAYSPSQNRGYIEVFQSDGLGNFSTTPFSFWVEGMITRGMVVRDLDGDGDLDVAVSAYECGSSTVAKIAVFENVTEAPLFTPNFDGPTTLDLVIAGPSSPGDLVRGDFWALSPGDSFQDLITPNPDADSYTKIRNLGQMTFAPFTVGEPSGCNPAWQYVTAAANKFGADQWWDFAAVDPDDLYVRIFRGNGLGTFTSPCNDAAYLYKLLTPDPDDPIGAHGVNTGNLNGGAYPEVVVALRNLEQYGEGPGWDAAAAVLVGKSDSSFRVPSAIQAYIYPATGAGGAMVEVVDLDDSGFEDIIITNHGSGGITVLLNQFQAITP